jgi:hypothetical protein
MREFVEEFVEAITLLSPAHGVGLKIKNSTSESECQASRKAGFQPIAFLDNETGEIGEQRLVHREEAGQFYDGLKD